MNNSYQMEFLKKLKESVPPQISLIEELAELLNISTDSVYRRFRGETALSLDETLLISNHYKINVLNQSAELGQVNFSYPKLLDSEESFESFLINILNDLQRLSLLNNTRITYSAQDLPIMMHMGFSPLCAFKFFYWMRGFMGIKKYENNQYDKNLIPAAFLTKARNIFDLYCKIPSTEIWSAQTIIPTMRQIAFFAEMGLFSKKEDFLEITDAMQDLIFTLKKWAEEGTKNNLGTYNLYQSELIFGNNVIIAESDQFSAVYQSHHTFNSMYSTDSAYLDTTKKWVNLIINKSTLISVSGEKFRNKFFKNIQLEMDQLKQLVNEI